MGAAMGFAVSLLGAGTAQAAPYNVLTIGDSTVYGTSSASSSALGYQTALKTLIDGTPGYESNFIGAYDDLNAIFSAEKPWDNGTGDYPDWPASYSYQHFGLPSGAILNTASDETTLRENLQNVGIQDADGVSDGDGSASFDLSGQTLSQFMTSQPDLIIMQAGLNDISREKKQYGSSPDGSPTINQLSAEYEQLLIEVANQFPTATVMVNLIAPKFDFNPGSGNNATAWNNSNYLNQAVKDLIDSIPSRQETDDLSKLDGRIVTNDLFQISVNDLIALGMPTNLVNVADNDGDDWVDWGNGYDESIVAGIDPDTTTTSGINSDLYSDFVHPTADGYEIWAWAMYGQLLNSGTIPEPGTASLLALGSLLILARRRRASAV
ncbi:MAG: PEP-CTERM sorting domain-containing protein [Planctomycetes bacterium]|nr:PEP-CTERM sorting domain-containing protein [Planctomycetota bacterium]